MRTSRALAWLALAACAVTASALDALLAAPKAAARSATAREASRPALGESVQRIVASTNAFRRQENLSATERNPQLAKAARYFSDFMARTDLYGHSADGSEPAERAKKFGYDYCIVAENIAYVFNSRGFGAAELAHRLFEGWQNSPEHRRNMLEPDVTDTAVAIAQSAKTGRFYAVQLFGRPKSASIQFQVENRAGVEVEYVLDGQTFALPPRVTRTHQGCTPFDLAFRGASVQPAHGQRLIVVNDRDGVQLKAQ